MTQLGLLILLLGPLTGAGLTGDWLWFAMEALIWAIPVAFKFQISKIVNKILPAGMSVWA